MPQLGEPYDWGNAWDGTEFEDIINELIEKTNGNKEQLDEIQAALDSTESLLKKNKATLNSIEKDLISLKKKVIGPLIHDFHTFKDDTIKTVVKIYKKLHEM
jgi:dsDNA-specific endonuclease/ATPase MutS2